MNASNAVLGNHLLSSAVLDIRHLLIEGALLAQHVRAYCLVALREIQLTHLVMAIVAGGVLNVERNVVVGNPVIALDDAVENRPAEPVGSRDGQLVAVKKRLALIRVDKLVLHVDAAALMRLLLG